jgi:hypothetical protein
MCRQEDNIKNEIPGRTYKAYFYTAHFSRVATYWRDYCGVILCEEAIT